MHFLHVTFTWQKFQDHNGSDMFCCVDGNEVSWSRFGSQSKNWVVITIFKKLQWATIPSKFKKTFFANVFQIQPFLIADPLLDLYIFSQYNRSLIILKYILMKSFVFSNNMIANEGVRHQLGKSPVARLLFIFSSSLCLNSGFNGKYFKK